MARGADYVVVFGGLNKSDYQDCEGHDRKEYGLPYGQDKLMERLAEVNPNLIFVNISGNAVAMPWKDKVAAIVQGWFIGSEAGNALADILTGKANPSGKLPFTWFANLNDVPAHRLNAYPGTWREGHDIIDEEYKEGFYMGYRGADYYKTKPLFAFGHGLSYTTFKLGKPTPTTSPSPSPSPTPAVGLVPRWCRSTSATSSHRCQDPARNSKALPRCGCNRERHAM